MRANDFTEFLGSVVVAGQSLDMSHQSHFPPGNSCPSIDPLEQTPNTDTDINFIEPLVSYDANNMGGQPPLDATAFIMAFSIVVRSGCQIWPKTAVPWAYANEALPCFAEGSES
jgi:hypothetical protein